MLGLWKDISGVEEAQGQINHARESVWVVTGSQGREELLGGRNSQCHIVWKSKSISPEKTPLIWRVCHRVTKEHTSGACRDMLACSEWPGRRNFCVQEERRIGGNLWMFAHFMTQERIPGYLRMPRISSSLASKRWILCNTRLTTLRLYAAL